jgi:uncharacterized protein (DUF2235 family)
VPNLSDADFVPVERMLAVGVFDTVSSMGTPRPIVGGLDYDFVIANTDLSTKVPNGYHALSADEDRATFFPTYWTPRRNVSQVIFPGLHSDVGGGYAQTGLSDRPLQWMLGNLRAQGLRFDLANIRALQPLSTASDMTTELRRPGTFFLRLRGCFLPLSSKARLPSLLTDQSVKGGASP